MNKNKKQWFSLLIIFIFVCLISINVFASQEPYVTYGETTTNILEQKSSNETYQSTQTRTPVTTNEKNEGDEVLPSKQKTELLKMKDESRDALTMYQQKYKNNIVYGTIAYVLNMIRLISIPFCIVGFIISVVYEYIIGMKRREMVRKGRGMRITLISTFVMAQVLPLIFAIVIKFWGN